MASSLRDTLEGPVRRAVLGIRGLKAEQRIFRPREAALRAPRSVPPGQGADRQGSPVQPARGPLGSGTVSTGALTGSGRPPANLSGSRSAGGETAAPPPSPAWLTVRPAHGVVQRAGDAPPRGAPRRVARVHAPCVLIVAPIPLVLKEISLVIVGPGEGGVDTAGREAKVGDGPRESFLYVSVLKHPVSVSWGEKERLGLSPPEAGAPAWFLPQAPCAAPPQHRQASRVFPEHLLRA